MSMFMKWPSSILGDISDQYGKKGFYALTPRDSRALRRYWGPLIAAVVAENLILPDKRSSSARKMLMKNAVSWTPASSLAPIISGEFAPAPIQLLQEAGSAAVDWDKLNGKLAAKTVMPVIPMATFVDFIWKDMPEWEELTD
jgi:hypothetical protein